MAKPLWKIVPDSIVKGDSIGHLVCEDEFDAPVGQLLLPHVGVAVDEARDDVLEDAEGAQPDEDVGDVPVGQSDVVLV